MPVTAIKNVRVFDGQKLTHPKTIMMKNGLITDDTSCDTMIDGSGCTLLPGLIDAHIHLTSIDNLNEAARHGITTMFDMTTPDPELIDSLRNLPGLTDIRSCYFAACSADSPLIKILGYPPSCIVASVTDAKRFVNEQVTLGADYLKVILEDPTMSPNTLSMGTVSALVDAAHQHNMRVFAHVTTPDTYRTAIAAGVDVLNHIPYVAELPEAIIELIVKKERSVIPTMIMQKGIVASTKKMNPHAPVDFNHVQVAVRNLHQAKATIIAGTDSNENIDFAKVPHGASLHTELELMVEAGLSPLEALQSATSLPARVFGLDDRGVIETGRRADLLLVAGDPTVDIKKTRAIQGVWIAGVEVAE